MKIPILALALIVPALAAATADLSAEGPAKADLSAVGFAKADEPTYAVTLELTDV